MAKANMLDMVNIELCMVEELQKQLKEIHEKYVSMHKTLEMSGVANANYKTLEDILITNNEIKKKLTHMLASRNGVQEKLIEEIKVLKEQ